MGATKGGKAILLLFFLLTAVPSSRGQYFDDDNVTSNCSKGPVFDDMLVSVRIALERRIPIAILKPVPRELPSGFIAGFLSNATA